MSTSTKRVAVANGEGAPNEIAIPRTTVNIQPVRFQRATFKLIALPDTPLVIHRFSAKTKIEMRQKMEQGKSASSRKNREAKDTEVSFNESRYVSRDNWDGFHAGSLRKALISACRLVNFKMVLAKLSVFVEADGVDALEPQIPLVRIRDCSPVKQEDMARVETGQPYVTIRASYRGWSARPTIRWDSDQFTLGDVTNLLSRVGQQVGIGEGRPDSKNSAGMGWGLFNIELANGETDAKS